MCQSTDTNILLMLRVIENSLDGISEGAFKRTHRLYPSVLAKSRNKWSSQHRSDGAL